MSGSENRRHKSSNYCAGFLEIRKGFGFSARSPTFFIQKTDPTFLSPGHIRRSSCVKAATSPGRATAASWHDPQLKAVDKVNEWPFEDYHQAVRLKTSPTIDPIEKSLENHPRPARNAHH